MKEEPSMHYNIPFLNPNKALIKMTKIASIKGGPRYMAVEAAAPTRSPKLKKKKTP